MPSKKANSTNGRPSSDENEKGKWEKFAEDQAQATPGDDSANNMDDTLHDGSEFDVDAIVDGLDSTDLQNQVQALQLKMDAFRDQAARAAAEIDNVQRRAERDVSNAHRYGNDKLITALLPVIDSMVRAQEGVDSTDPQVTAMLDGVRMTLDLLESTLAKFGLEAIEPAIGDPFNPDTEEAMSMVPHPDLAKNSVVEVLQKGYQLHGRVLRAAMVIVAN